MSEKSKRQQYLKRFAAIEGSVLLAFAALIISSMVIFLISGRISLPLIIAGSGFSACGGWLFYVSFTKYAKTKNKECRRVFRFFGGGYHETVYVSSEKSVRSQRLAGVASLLVGACLIIVGILTGVMT